jgi:hypothetical protein
MSMLMPCWRRLMKSAKARRRSRDDPHHVSVDGRDYHTWRELAEAFELDIHDFSVTEANR